MSTLVERLAAAREHQRTFNDDPTRQAGRAAERQAGEALALRLAGTGWQIHAGRRVPDPATRQRREIDFVITSPTEAVVVELKNWSGTVRMEGREVVQERRGQLGVVRHGALFEDLAERTRVLLRHHVAAGYPSCPVRSLVAFHNPRVHLARDVVSRKDVASFEALVGNMPAGASGPERALQAVFRILGFTANAPAKVSPTVQALRTTLEALGTWDLVRVHGGRTLSGDVLDRRDRDLAHALGRDADRAHARRIEMEVGRSLVAAIFRAPPRRAHILLRNGSTRVHDVPGDGVIRVQPAGSRNPETIALHHIVSIDYGYAMYPEFHGGRR